MVKIGKKNGKTYAVFEGMYDLFKLEDGIYLVVSNEKIKELVKKRISPELKEKKEEKEKSNKLKIRKGLNEREMKILIKISLIRFIDRDWDNVMKILKKGDQIILKSLIKRGYVKVLKRNGKQYISFSEDMYEKLKEETKKRITKEKPKIVSIEDSFFIVPKEYINKFTKDRDLNVFSYVIDREETLFAADKKKAKQLHKKMLNVLKKGRARYDEIAQKTKLREEVVLIILKLLSEEGVVYEPEKNIFELVE